MEGATSAKVCPGLFQRNVALDDINDINAAKQFLNKAIGNHRNLTIDELVLMCMAGFSLPTRFAGSMHAFRIPRYAAVESSCAQTGFDQF